MKKRVLLCIDRPGWCFDNIAQQVKKYCSDEFDIDIRTISEAFGTYDVIVAFWYGFLPMLAQRLRTGVGVLCVYDDYSWHQPGGRQQLDAALHYCDMIGCANEGILKGLDWTPQPKHLIEDGVDTDLFTPLPYPDEFTVGWCGNSAAAGKCMGDTSSDLKGLEVIREACKLAKVPLLVHDVAVDEPIPHEKMPEWYAKISCYVCASEAEGTPNPPLEALACGRPVITTPVGIMPKVVRDGSNGITVAGDVGQIRYAVAAAAAATAKGTSSGAKVPAAIAMTAESWSWRHKVEAWRGMLREAGTL